MEKDPYIGSLFAERYLINYLAARGGMGNIYQAHDVRNGSVVAVKMLRAEYGEDPIIVRRFMRETDAVSRLKHPNICQLFDTGCTEEGIHYFTMEFLEGEALDAILKRERTLAPEVVVKYMIEVAKALCDAHNNGIVHRDLKPANIFIIHQADSEDAVKVLDFGVAKMDDDPFAVHEKLTRAGATLGTPFYMSPEQIQGAELDGRADVYSLGVIMWECLFGMPPFMGKNLLEIFRSTMNDKLPKLPEQYRSSRYWRQLYSILSKAMEKNAQRRYSSMQEFQRALEQLESGEKSSISNATPRFLPALEVLDFFHRVSPVKLIVGGCIAIMLVGCIVYGVLHFFPNDIAIPQKKFGTYKFMSNEPAMVQIDGHVQGMTPLSLELSKQPPFNAVFLTGDGRDHIVTIDEKSDDIVGFAVNLEPQKNDEPMVELSTTPENAEVYVNGKLYVMKTPCKISTEAYQVIHLTIKYPDYRTEQIKVIPNGGDIKVHTNLFRR